LDEDEDADLDPDFSSGQPEYVHVVTRGTMEDFVAQGHFDL